MSNKNCLLLYQNRYYTRVEIRCDVPQYDDTISFIMEILSYAAKGKNIFVEYYGHNPELEVPDNVIEQKNETKDAFKKTLWMREAWLSITNKSFVEEPYSILYIFDSDYSWETFLGCARSGLHNMIRTPQLQLLASFGECQFPCLYIKHGNSAEMEIPNYFKRKGFVLKHRIC